jgi:uncharacterized cupredoxin-like copper-binding protein
LNRIGPHAAAPVAVTFAAAAMLLAGCREPAPAAHELTIVANEYGFQMPDSVPAGLVHITLHNAGHDIHEAVLAHFFDTSYTAAKYADSIHAGVDFPSNAEEVGGAALTLPGDSSGVWLRLAPGRYAVLCWKGDHLSRGMMHDLRVVASKGPAAEAPKATRELALVDFAYQLDTPFTAGRHILHVRNAGTEDHEADIVKASATAGVREYIAWMDAHSPGLPPVAPVAAFGDIYPGREAWIELHLTPGRYFIVCQVPAKSDGRPHYKHGMISEFTVPEPPPVSP